MRQALVLTLMVILLLLISACSNKKAQSKKYFRMAPYTSTVVVAEPSPLTLVVKRPKALSILGGRPIVATQADGSLVQLSHNFWLESPKVLLQDRIKYWATNQWQHVAYQVPNNDEHVILESRILAFEKNQDQAMAELEFKLYDANNRLLSNHRLSASKTITEEGYKAFTQAITAAVDDILHQLKLAMDYVE